MVSRLSTSLVTVGEEEGCLEGVPNKVLLVCNAPMLCFVIIINNKTNDKVPLWMFWLGMLICPSTTS